VLAVPVAVVQKFGNDRAGAFATRIAYQALFSLFPLLLLFSTVLGWLLEDRPALRNDIIDSALRDFPIIGQELRSSERPLGGSGIGLLIGILGTLYGALGFGHATEAAMNTVWNIPRSEWPNFAYRRIRSVAVVIAIGGGAVASAVVGTFVTNLGQSSALAGFAASLLIDTGVFMLAFMVLTARPLSWRDVGLGAVLAALVWGHYESLWRVVRLARPSWRR
jgi:uncharacterized BrkB/YihY/UPF0761 family membrane protein